MTVKLAAGKYDISQLADKITWSGDTKQVARQLAFAVPRMEGDKQLPKVSIAEGDPVTLTVDGKELYYGIIMDVERNVSFPYSQLYGARSLMVRQSIRRQPRLQRHAGAHHRQHLRGARRAARQRR